MAIPKTIEHKNGKILYFDHRGLSGDDLLTNFIDGTRYVLTQGNDLLMLADFRDATISPAVSKYIQGEETKEASAHYKKQAIVGITGIKKMVLNVYNALTKSNSKAFNSIEEAKDYLVSSQ